LVKFGPGCTVGFNQRFNCRAFLFIVECVEDVCREVFEAGVQLATVFNFV